MVSAIAAFRPREQRRLARAGFAAFGCAIAVAIGASAWVTVATRESTYEAMLDRIREAEPDSSAAQAAAVDLYRKILEGVSELERSSERSDVALHHLTKLRERLR